MQDCCCDNGGSKLRKGTYLRLNVLLQNLQLYGRSPESMPSSVSPRHHLSAKYITTIETVVTYAAADVLTNAPFAETSFRKRCMSTGFEPPS
jgi:hypothetical protein